MAQLGNVAFLLASAVENKLPDSGDITTQAAATKAVTVVIMRQTLGPAGKASNALVLDNRATSPHTRHNNSHKQPIGCQ